MTSDLLQTVIKLSEQFRTEDSSKKFSICDELSQLLFSGKINFCSDDIFQNFRIGLRSVLQSRLSTDFRKSAICFANSLFYSFKTTWLGKGEDGQMLLVLLTNISSIEIRVCLANRENLLDLRTHVDLETLLGCVKCLRGCLRALGEWIDSAEGIRFERVTQIFQCLSEVMSTVLEFLDACLLLGEYESDTELRSVFERLMELISHWSYNDTQTLSKEIWKLFPLVEPLIARYRWIDVCLNVMMRLDMAEDDVISELTNYKPDRQFLEFGLHCCVRDELEVMMTHQDERLPHCLHYLIVNSESLLDVEAVSSFLKQNFPKLVARGLGAVSRKQDSDQSKRLAYDSMCLLYIAALALRIGMTSSLNEDDRQDQAEDLFIVSCVQVLWAFVGFAKNRDENNAFHLASAITQSLDADVIGECFSVWSDAVKHLGECCKSSRRLVNLLARFGFLQRATLVPLMGTIEMPEECEEALKFFFSSVAMTNPELEKMYDTKQEEMLMKLLETELSVSLSGSISEKDLS